MQARTIIKKHQFLNNFISCGRNVSKTCEKVRVSRWTFYEWKRTDVDFLMDFLVLEDKKRIDRKWMVAEINARWLHKGVKHVCEMSGLSRWTYYNWRNNDKIFNNLLELEEREWRDLKEAVYRRREHMLMESCV